tara:strand:- start:1465 stop:3561 length:2097 start_codon:yes stop_codon:yes gene_type:complete
MSTVIQIKRNATTTAPGTSDLVVGEMAYAYDASNDGAGAKLYIEAVNSSSAAVIHAIGGKYFTDLLDHTAGTVTASSALIVDSNKKLNELLVDNVTIDGNDISSTNSNGDLTFTPNGTGIVDINKNDGFKLPVGTTAQRSASPVQGQIRYNSTLSSFEGYSGSAWGSLGGTIDVDQDTKITTEESAGSDEDQIKFFTAGTAQVIIKDGSFEPITDSDIDLGASGKEFKDLFIDGTANIDALVADTADINGGSVDGVTIGSNAVATILNVDNLRLDANTISSTDSDGHIEISPNGTGNVHVNSDGLVVLSAASEDARVQVQGGEGGNAILKLIADDSDDNGDDWTIKNAASNNGLTIESDISGSNVAQVTLTPNATVANSTFAIAGKLTVAGTTEFSGAIDFNSQAMTEINIDGGAIDGVTIGTNSAVTDLRVDNLKVDGNDISSTDSNGNVTITPNGTGDVVVNSDQLIISGGEGETSTLMFRTDEGDDNGDDWTISNSTGNVLSINNDISGSAVAHVQFTPNSTVLNSTAAFAGDVTVAGDLTVSGDTTTVSSTNTVVADKLVELANGTSGTPSGDVGHIFERGSSANIFVGFDESADQFIAASGTFTGATTGDLTIAAYVDAHFKELTLETDLTVPNGGTGVSSFTDNGIVYGDGSNALDVTAAAGSSDATTSNQLLTVDGSGVPVFTTTIDGGTY